MVNSTWDGRWIIQRAIRAPSIVILEPYPDEDSEKVAKNRFRLTKNLSEARTIDRADKQRFYAWGSCYGDILEAKIAPLNESQTHMRRIQKVIAEKFTTQPLTGRMKRFIAFVKDIHKQGDKFIIVSDRLFPLALTFYVLIL
jgi:hypothetical protein